jgi:hypothetical protein
VSVGPLSSRAVRAVLVAVVVAIAVAMLCGAARAAGSETVTTCGAGVFSPGAVFGINTSMYCPPGTNIPPGITIQTGPNQVPAGQRASWEADAPAGLAITGASIQPYQMYSIHINDGRSWGGGFYWANGGAQTFDNSTTFGVSGINSSYFGLQVICGWKTCNGNTNPAQLTVESIALSVAETQGPWLASPSGLWQAGGWVRGQWPLDVYGDSPSGLCEISATLSAQPIPGASSSSPQDGSVWHQCGASGVDPTVSTWLYGQGAVPLTLSAVDAAGAPVNYTKTVYIDNSQPTVSYSGPSNAAWTGATEYVTAAGGGSVSGIAGLQCSVDGAAAQWYVGASAQVPVSGVGTHAIGCRAADNAVDSAGDHGWSAWQSFSIKLGLPTVSGIGFGRLVDKLRCRKVAKRVLVPAHWVTVRRDHKLERVHKRARTRVVKVTVCHPRVVLQRVTVWKTVTRHGKRHRVKREKTVRVPLVPHMVEHSTRRVAYGRGTMVNGWLGTSSGVALGGQTVHVLGAPDNGLGQFTTAADAITAADGSWSARLAAGPSRLVEAVYYGGPTTEQAVSAAVHLIVPAKVRLISVWPPRVPWGGTVRIVGQLQGGYLPAGGALVRLRIGTGSVRTTYGVKEHVSGGGRFTTSYTFGLGDPSSYESFWFQLASLPMGAYAYAPGASARRAVTVGGHPHLPPTPPHQSTRRHRKSRAKASAPHHSSRR